MAGIAPVGLPGRRREGTGVVYEPGEESWTLEGTSRAMW